MHQNITHNGRRAHFDLWVSDDQCYITLVPQLFADFRTLLENLKANTTSACCFSGTNITVINRLFSTHADPIPAIVNIFVSYLPQCLSLFHYTEVICIKWQPYDFSEMKLKAN